MAAVEVHHPLKWPYNNRLTRKERGQAPARPLSFLSRSTRFYSKGAYILHMLEMQMWTPAGGEASFKRSMQHFVAEYAGRAATTEDWKRSLEQTMPGDLDLRPVLSD